MIGTPELRHDITAVDKSSAAWRSFERNASRVDRQIKSMTAEMSKFGSLARAGLAGLGVGVATAGFSELIGGVRTAVTKVAELGDAAERAGVAAEFLQTLRYQLEQNGAAARDADEAIRRFNRRLGEFVNSGGGPAAKAFKELGIQTVDAAGKVRSTEAIYRDVVATLGQFDDQARVAAIAAQLFGDDAGPRLVAAIRQGILGLIDAQTEIRTTAALLDEELVRAAGELDKAMTRLDRRWGAIWVRMAVTAAENASTILTQFDRIFRVTRAGEIESLQFQISALVAERVKLEDRIAAASANPRNIPGMANPLSGFLNRSGIEEDTKAVGALNDRIGELQDRITSLQGRRDDFEFPAITPKDLPPLEDGEDDKKTRSGTRRRSLLEDETWNAFNRNVKSAKDEMTRLNREADNLKSAGEAFGSTLAGALGRAVDGTLSLKDALGDVLRQLASSALQSVFSKLGGQVFGSLFGGSRFAGFFAEGGRIPAGMFGIAGEAGPEIVSGPANVAPLGGGVNVNIINASGEKVETRETRTAQGGRNLEVMIGKVVAGQIATPGSPVARSLQTVHGLSPNVTRRS